MSLELNLIEIAEPELLFGYGQSMEHPKDGLLLYGPKESAQAGSKLRIGVVSTKEGLRRYSACVARLAKPIAGAGRQPQPHPVSGLPSPVRRGVARAARDMAGNRRCRARQRDPHLRPPSSDPQGRLALFRCHRQSLARRQRIDHRPVDGRGARGCPQVLPAAVQGRGQSEAALRRADGQGGGDPAAESSGPVQRRQRVGRDLPLRARLPQPAQGQAVGAQGGGAGGPRDHARPRGVRPRQRHAGPGPSRPRDPCVEPRDDLLFEAGGKPWQLAASRPGVCYVGIVFKKDSSSAEPGNACCGAQMFLDSGDGVVFRGAVGPWLTSTKDDFHLPKEKAKSLMAMVVDAYRKNHGGLAPKELFIHGKTRFSAEEWEGFKETVPPETNVVCVRIRQDAGMKLYRHER